MTERFNLEKPIKVIFTKENGYSFEENFATQEEAEIWRLKIMSGSPEGKYKTIIENITQELATAETERKNKKKAIKDALELITDANTKKVLKYLLRNIDNEE